MEDTNTKSSTTQTNLIGHVQDVFNTYLTLDPSEVSRVTVLAEQMIDGDQGLYSRQNMKGHLTASALVLDQNDRVLLILHNALKRWLQPGGHLDQGEDPEQAMTRALQRLEIVARRQVNHLFAGDYHSSFRGRGMSFEDLRLYQPGDEVRWIDWNVSARMGDTYVKQFAEERERSVMILSSIAWASANRWRACSPCSGSSRIAG